MDLALREKNVCFLPGDNLIGADPWAVSGVDFFRCGSSGTSSNLLKQGLSKQFDCCWNQKNLVKFSPKLRTKNFFNHEPEAASFALVEVD